MEELECDYYFTSAFDGTGVEEAFRKLIRMGVESKRE